MLPLLREPFADDVTERICHAMKPNTMILNNAGTPLVIKVCNKYVRSGSIFVVVIEVADDAMGRLSTALDKIEDDATAAAAAVAILFGSNVIIVMTVET